MYYELYYVERNNGETSDSKVLKIARSTNKEDIEKIIKDYDIKYVTKLAQGQAHVFVYQEWEPNFPLYFNKEMLMFALKDKAVTKEESDRLSDLIRDLDLKAFWQNNDLDGTPNDEVSNPFDELRYNF